MRAREHIRRAFFGEVRFSDDQFFWEVFLEGEKKARVWRVKRCIRKVYIYNILLIFLGEK